MKNILILFILFNTYSYSVIFLKEVIVSNENIESRQQLNLKPFLFKVNNSKKETTKLDLTNYKIFINKPFFIGLKNTDKFNYSLGLTDANENSSSIYLKLDENKWHTPPNLIDKTFKLEVDIK